jgi:hypothetical protein
MKMKVAVLLLLSAFAFSQQPAAPDTNWACALVGDTSPVVFCHARGVTLNSSIQLTLPAFIGTARVLLGQLNPGTYRVLLCPTDCSVDAQIILAAQPVADHDNSLYFELPTSGILQVFQTTGTPPPPPGTLFPPTNLIVEVQ